jgi:FADH2 O2-dependent halogenase
MKESGRYDVAILGTGLAGTMLGAILARHGARVVMLEKGAHPRFAIGEATLPQSTLWTWILGQRYGVPEIQHLARTDTIYHHVGPSCGWKRVIGFLYHEEGKRQDPSHANLLVPPVQPLTMESHLFRQDVDLYMLKAAMGYGAEYREETDVREFGFDGEGVTLSTDQGETLQARYLVDASGFRSPVAERFGLREKPSTLETQSRSIFNHFEGVKLYDDILEPGEGPGLSARWSDGTIHHVFEGGWFWVIPFNNYPGSENPLCSIGLTLNLHRHPPTGASPEEEWNDIVSRYPSIARHLEGARPVRDWVSTGRLQYSSTAAAGPRYFLLAHAHGFVDALYSRGLINSFEVINALAAPLLAALADDDFSAERFAPVERLQEAGLRSGDRMVASSYRAFPSYDTWNAWLRIWLLNKFFGDLRLFSVCMHFVESHDPEVFDRLLQDPLPFSVPGGANELEQLFLHAEALLKRVEAGELPAESAAAQILERLESAQCLPPVYGWTDPADTHLDFLPEKMGRTVMWGKMEAPAALRDRFFAWDPAPLLGGGPPSAAPGPGGEAAGAEAA